MLLIYMFGKFDEKINVEMEYELGRHYNLR